MCGSRKYHYSPMEISNFLRTVCEGKLEFPDGMGVYSLHLDTNPVKMNLWSFYSVWLGLLETGLFQIINKNINTFSAITVWRSVTGE